MEYHTKPDVVLLSTADWDHPLWTNKQHVACSLAAVGFRVLYVESLGLRSVQAKGRDLLRIFRRLCRGLLPPRAVRPGIWVCSPLVVPGGSEGLILKINRLLLAVSIGAAKARLNFQHAWLWTYNPLTLRYLNVQDYRLRIYHAVDALQEQPGMQRQLIDNEERRLCELVDQVFVTSPQLELRLLPFAKRLRYDPNVADQMHFSAAMEVDLTSLPSDLAQIKEPRIGFIGAISSYKLDFPLIAALALHHPKWQFVFIGPTAEGEASTDLRLWDGLSNIHCLGPRQYRHLPNYCAGFQCGWLPLQKNKYTASMFPMKFFEYLSAGLPIVATRIEALEEFAAVAWLCEPQKNDFSKALQSCLRGDGPNRYQRLAIAKEHTYTARLDRMLHELKSQELI